MRITLEMRLLYWLTERRRPGRTTFTGHDIETAGPTHLGSTWMRSLRELRRKGLLDYKVTNAHKSQYELLTPLEDMVSTFNTLRRNAS